MKIVPSKHSDAPTKKAPLLPLIPDPLDEMTSENSISYMLRTVPADANSSTYKKYVRVLSGSETVRTMLRWGKDTQQVIVGLNVTNAAAQFNLYLNMTTGTAAALLRQHAKDAAEAAYEAAQTAAADAAARQVVIDAGWEPHLTVADVSTAKNLTLTALIPQKIVAMVKRYLRRECRKPADMKVRTYYQHLLRMNQDELPALPPFARQQFLVDDELIDILCFGTPKSWSREMDRQGFDPLTSTPGQVVDFLERIEQSEDFDGQKVDHSQKNGNNKKDSSKKKSNGKSGSKYCMLHGKGGHSTDECHTLKEQTKKMKSGSSDSSDKKKFGNKTWTRKATDATSASKKELAAFVKKTVAKKIKEINSVDKKRKADDDDSSVDLNAFDKKPAAKPVAKRQINFADMLDGDLKDFNYNDMEKLTIEDDEEEEVAV